MEYRIETIESKNLIGMHLRMSLSNNKTPDLWQKFMPERKDVKNRVNSDYISMQVYAENQKDLFAPATQFEKWAVVEVSTNEEIPDGMEFYSLKGGKYAVFIHNGPASTFSKTMQYILGVWLPESEYELDNREFFEVLSEDYTPTDSEAREEVWIPIKTQS